MINTQKLKGIRVEKGYTVEQLAKSMGLTSKTMSVKLNDKTGKNLTVPEVEMLVALLQISNFQDVFFVQ
jgi:DNA-binding XRE family transcriptional regulator